MIYSYDLERQGWPTGRKITNLASAWLRLRTFLVDFVSWDMVSPILDVEPFLYIL